MYDNGYIGQLRYCWYRLKAHGIMQRKVNYTVAGDRSEKSSLSTAEAVATAVVVCVVCSFTAGLLLGVLLTQCHGHCHRKQKRGQTEIPPVYEDIPLEKTPPAIELHSNDAYGPIPQ